MAVEDLTLGRGEIHFAQFKSGTQTPRGERYFGNTPEFNVAIEEQNLDHYNSDRGIRVKDNSVLLQVDRTSSIVTDAISPENLALFFTGSKSVLSVVGATVTDEPLADVEKGLTYQLGMSALNPTGVRGLTQHTAPTDNVIVKKGATTYVEGTDYTIDMELARLSILVGGSIVDGDDITVSYKTSTHSRTVIVSGNKAIEGALRYIAYNAVGAQQDIYMPWVKIMPNGDFSLKSGDDWAQLPFNLEILKKSDREAIYIDGRPYTP